jgi:hypothetical protein
MEISREVAGTDGWQGMNTLGSILQTQPTHPTPLSKFTFYFQVIESESAVHDHLPPAAQPRGLPGLLPHPLVAPAPRHPRPARRARVLPTRLRLHRRRPAAGRDPQRARRPVHHGAQVQLPVPHVVSLVERRYGRWRGRRGRRAGGVVTALARSLVAPVTEFPMPAEHVAMHAHSG